MTILQQDIGRIGIDAFIENIVVNIFEDLKGGRLKNQISDYYMTYHDIDVTFSETTVNIRLYTENEGWNQSSHEIKLK